MARMSNYRGNPYRPFRNWGMLGYGGGYGNGPFRNWGMLGYGGGYGNGPFRVPPWNEIYGPIQNRLDETAGLDLSGNPLSPPDSGGGGGGGWWNQLRARQQPDSLFAQMFGRGPSVASEPEPPRVGAATLATRPGGDSPPGQWGSPPGYWPSPREAWGNYMRPGLSTMMSFPGVGVGRYLAAFTNNLGRRRSPQDKRSSFYGRR